MSFNAANQAFDEEEELRKKQTSGVANKRCQGCNSPLVFDPTTQKLKCEYCETEYDIPKELDENERQEQQKAQATPSKAGTNAKAQNQQAPKARNRKGERPLSEADSKESCDWGSKKKMVTCKACGAQTIYDAVQTASTCPYCDSTQMMEQDQPQDNMAPTGICVFKVDRTKARQQFTEWVNGLWFAPNKLKKVANADTMNGMYLPHWTFDTEAFADYTGEYGIDREEKDSNGNTRTKTDWYSCSGSIKHFFDDFIMPACKKENNHILESLQPFNTNDYEDYKPEYMAGYVAERYSVTIHEAWKTAQERMKDDMDDFACKDIKDKNKKADRARTKHIEVTFEDVAFKYLFLPIWLSSYKYNGKVYQFMVNGQTGKVSGDRPYSIWKILFAILCVVIVLMILFSGE